MTRIIYENIPVIFETNGDCSSITLNFPVGMEKFVHELRIKLKANGLLVQERLANDCQIKLVGRLHET